MNNFSSISKKIENAKALDFGDIINRSFELFKKGWIQGFLLILTTIIIMLPVAYNLYSPIIGEMMRQIRSGNSNPDMLIIQMMFAQELFMYKVLAVNFFAAFISTILVAGFYRIIKKIDFGEAQSFSDLFYFFKGKYLGKVFFIAAFSLLIALINFGLNKFLPPSIASLLSSGLSIASSVYTTLFVVFFAFNPDMESSEIFSLTFNLGTKKWLIIFGLSVVTFIIGMLGVIACGIGVLFTLSIIYFSPYIVYKDIIGFDSFSDIERIGSNNESDY